MPGLVSSTGSEPRATGTLPSFSVVIPAFQAAAHISAAVSSVLEQHPPALDVIVCDDGSTDGTADALARFGRSVRVVRKANGGEASARNAGARVARGDYVAFLDADDRFLPGRLEALGQAASAQPDVDVFTTDAFLEVDDRFVGRCYEDQEFPVGDQRRAILTSNFVFGHVAIRRSCLLAAGGYDESIRFTTDWELWIRLILAGSRVALVDAPLAVYRLHPGAASSRRLEMCHGRLSTLAKAREHPCLSDPERAVVEETIAAERLRLQREQLLEALAAGDRTAARWLAHGCLGSASQPRRARVRAAVALVAPRFAGLIVRRERRRYAVGAGERRIARVPEP
ncbi:MAG: glycosyltransferase [Acidimicrobiia bacterium]|nr:glycosyltransferase [Acidimicrobiia bacterium]